MNRKQQLEQQYAEAIRYLDNNFAYFLTYVLKIGKPRWTNSIPTAAIAVKSEEKREIEPDDLEFIFNPDFAETLTIPQYAFILGHETYHVLRNHLRLAGNFVNRDRYVELSRKRGKGKRLTADERKEYKEMREAAKRFNIAADCVINDDMAVQGFEIWGAALRGRKVVGEDCAYLTVTDVYQLLLNQKCSTCGGSGEVDDDKQGQGSAESDSKANGDNQEGQDKDEAGNGSNSPQDGEKVPCPDCQGDYDEMDSHEWMFDPEYADEIADAIDQFLDDMDDAGKLPSEVKDANDEEEGKMTAMQKQLREAATAGSEDGQIRAFMEQHGVEMHWVKLLKEVDPDMFEVQGLAPPPVPSFHQRRRKLNSAAFKKVILPVMRENVSKLDHARELPAVVLALDCSASIGATDAQRFLTLAKSIPQDRVKLFACTFEYSYKVLDLDNPHGPGLGGTNFNAIANFIENEVKPQINGYPKAVIVITDGEATMSHALRPTEDEQKSWFWLLSPRDKANEGSHDASLTIGRRAMLDGFIKG